VRGSGGGPTAGGEQSRGGGLPAEETGGGDLSESETDNGEPHDGRAVGAPATAGRAPFCSWASRCRVVEWPLTALNLRRVPTWQPRRFQ
jgi:hypothetical protein